MNTRDIGLLIVRILVAAFGMLMIYTALFLYEDEEGRLQNRLEELWIRLNDISQIALARHTAFLRQTILLLTSGLDVLFGPKLCSLRAAAVTLAYSAASMLMLTSATQLEFIGIGGELKGLICFLMLILMGSAFAFITNRVTSWVWSTVVIVLAPAIYICGAAFIVGYLNWELIRAAFSFFTTTSYGQLYLIGLLGGIISDLVFVILIRAILKATGALNNMLKIVALLAGNILLAGICLGPYFYYFPTPFKMWQLVLFRISSSNLVAAILALTTIFMLLALFLHRIFWPLINRPVYAIERNRILGNHKVLLSTSIVLLTWAIPAWRPFWELVGKVK